MIKTLTHPTTGKVVKFGRTRQLVRGPRLSLSNYMLRARATGKAPTGFDWTQLVADFDALGGSL